MGSETLSSARYILSNESSITFFSTSNGYKRNLKGVTIADRYPIPDFNGVFVELRSQERIPSNPLNQSFEILFCEKRKILVHKTEKCTIYISASPR